MFTIQGEGIFPRHVRVELGEQNATLKPLSEATKTSVRGDPLEGTTICEYPVRLCIGEVDVLVDKAPKGLSPSSVLDVASGFVRNTFSEVKKGPEKYFQRTMAFGLETDPAPFGNFVTSEKIYALKSEIARGGMGHVFLAEDRTLNRQVALKVGNSAEAAQKAAFYREAKILSRLSHPNIVPVHNFGEDAAGRPFYSMKLVRGQTLQSVIKNLQKNDPLTALEFSLQHLLSVFRRVCNAIEFAHSAGYLHRDLKPENVMIGEHSEVWVMDWGLAQVLGRTSSLLSADTARYDRKYAVEGTPQYMSPEQASGKALDERTDIYSLGAMLYAMLTLQAPVQGTSLSDILKKVKSGAVSAMQAHFPRARVTGRHATKQKAIPPALEAVVHKAMHLDPAKRYMSVTDLIWDIEAYQSGFATSAEDAGVIRQIGLLICRHRALAAVVAISLAGAVISALCLAAGERDAREHALLAKENARLAEESVSYALAVESAAVELCNACCSVMTSAILAPTSSTGDEMTKPFNLNLFVFEAFDYTSAKPATPDSRKSDELIVLLSYGSIRLVNWTSHTGSTFGKVNMRDCPPSTLSVPPLFVLREVARIAVLSNFENRSAAVSRPLEIMMGSRGMVSTRSALKLSEKFFMKLEFPFGSEDQRLLWNAPDKASVPLLALCNQCADAPQNASSTPDATFKDGPQVRKQVVRLYLGSQIVQLDAMTRAFFCTIFP